MTTIEKLKKMRELLTPDGAWTQENYARTKEGISCPANSEAAVCWCLVGAGFTLEESVDVEFALMGFLRTTGFHRDLVTWNDTTGRTQAEVLAAIDGTIKGLEA